MSSGGGALADLHTGKWPIDSVEDEELCKVAARFFVSYAPTQEQYDDPESYLGPGTWITAQYMAYWYWGKQEDIDVIQRNQQLLVDQWISIERNGVDGFGSKLEDFVFPIINDCTASVCRELGWEGNSDLAGIGVYSSYYIQAILTTLYLIPLIAIRLGWISGTGRISEAFTGTVGDLVQSVYVFSIAVLAASLYIILRLVNDGDLSVSRYDIVVSVLVSIVSACPATALYAVGGKGKGPKHLLRVILLGMWVLMLAVANIGRQADPNVIAKQVDKAPQPFEVFCDVIGQSSVNGIRIFSIVAVALGAIWIAYLTYRKVSSGKSLAEIEDDRDMKWGRVIIAFLSWAVMWVFIGLFTLVRSRIISVAGESDKSNEWNFGQIVALATWAPVIINFVGALIMGVDGSHDTRLPEGYTVTQTASGGGSGSSADKAV